MSIFDLNLRCGRPLTLIHSNTRSADKFISIGALFLFALSTILLTQTSAAEPHDKSDTTAQDSATVAILEGTIRNQEGSPLVGVRIRVAVPAGEMRFVRPEYNGTYLETKTVKNGQYRIEIPGLTKPTKISIDARKPGYRRLTGTLMQGGDNRDIEVTPGETIQADWTLKSSAYFAGIVVDEEGNGIADVSICANANNSVGSAGVERSTTRDDGTFELFNYDDEPFKLDNKITKGVIDFEHQNYLSSNIEDIHSIEKPDRKAIKIVLQSGREISGTVIDVDGKPVPNVMIAISLINSDYRKGTKTDANGKFVLRGLSTGLSVAVVHALEMEQKRILPIGLYEDREDVEVRLEAIALPPDLKTEMVLGMKLTDASDEMRRAYDLFNDGALIMDIGTDSDRLKIGQLEKGFTFWMVGNSTISSVKDFVEHIVLETSVGEADEYSVRVVYTFKTTEFIGTNTQYLKLTKDDVSRLKQLSEKLNAK